jgi:mutator protein MutT
MHDAGAAGILIHDLKILLAKRSAGQTFYPNVWDLPGGHLEAGESPETALVRDKEELGIVATAFDSLGTFQELNPEGYERTSTMFIWSPVGEQGS